MRIDQPDQPDQKEPSVVLVGWDLEAREDLRELNRLLTQARKDIARLEREVAEIKKGSKR